MTAYALLPLLFIKFWYLDAPLRMCRSFFSFNREFLHLLSLPLFLRTFFKPLKNEYRAGLVGFSVGMGIAVKSILILVDLLVLAVLLLVEILILAGFLFVPLGTMYLLWQ